MFMEANELFLGQTKLNKEEGLSEIRMEANELFLGQTKLNKEEGLSEIRSYPLIENPDLGKFNHFK